MLSACVSQTQRIRLAIIACAISLSGKLSWFVKQRLGTNEFEIVEGYLSICDSVRTLFGDDGLFFLFLSSLKDNYDYRTYAAAQTACQSLVHRYAPKRRGQSIRRGNTYYRQ